MPCHRPQPRCERLSAGQAVSLQAIWGRRRSSSAAVVSLGRLAFWLTTAGIGRRVKRYSALRASSAQRCSRASFQGRQTDEFVIIRS
ncbi:hypothetical protein BDV09DRAFT_166614 [Aspergillus tetrazonus]